MKIGVAFSVLLGAIGVQAGTGTDNNGDELKLIFTEAKILASQKVRGVLHCAIDDVFSGEVKDWILAQKEDLSLDLLISPHQWLDEDQTQCARTVTEKGAPVRLSFQNCDHERIDVQMAAKILIHESVHHFGIEDESFSDQVAIAIMGAREVDSCIALEPGQMDVGIYDAAQLSPSKKVLVTWDRISGYTSWSLSERRKLAQFNVRGRTTPRFSISPDDQRVAGYLEESKLAFWSVRTGKLDFQVELPAQVQAPRATPMFSWSKDSRYLAVLVPGGYSYYDDNKVCVVDLEEERAICHDENSVWNYRFLPDSEQVLMINTDCRVRIWFFRTGEVEERWQLTDPRTGFPLGACVDTIISAENDWVVYSYDTFYEGDGDGESVMIVASLRSGEQLIVREGVRYHSRTPSFSRTYPSVINRWEYYSQYMESVLIDRDTKILGVPVIWRMDRPEDEFFEIENPGWTRARALSQGGRFFARTKVSGQSAEIWDLERGEKIRVIDLGQATEYPSIFEFNSRNELVFLNDEGVLSFLPVGEP